MVTVIGTNSGTGRVGAAIGPGVWGSGVAAEIGVGSLSIVILPFETLTFTDNASGGVSRLPE